jgi:Kef-type K+ transport system membrane component KefB
MNIWLVAALWVGLALVAALGSIGTGVSVALIEIAVGVLAGNPVPMHRMRAIAFSVLTPFYFLKAGSLVAVKSLVTPMALTIVVGLLAVQIATQFVPPGRNVCKFVFPRALLKSSRDSRGLFSTGLKAMVKM